MTLTEARLIEKTDGPPWDIDAYVKVGGYEAWKKCVKGLTPDQVVQELKTSGMPVSTNPAPLRTGTC